MAEGFEDDIIRVINYKERSLDGSLNVDDVIESALGHLESVAIVGKDKDGEYYFASNLVDRSKINWMLDRFKLLLLES